MARLRTVQISALNIAMENPHSPAAYVELFLHAYRQRQVIRDGELHAMMLGSLSGARDAVDRDELTGEIFRFVKINANEPWFNTRTNEVASEEEMEAINIPEHLRAQFQRIEFVFYPRSHQLWFLRRSGSDALGPRRAESFFQSLFDGVRRDADPPVYVTCLPDPAALDEMFGIHRIQKLVLEFKRPNPDDVGALSARIMRRMEEQRVGTYREELTASGAAGLQPDQQTRAEAAVAAMNGVVAAKGKDVDGNTVERSTQDKPMVLARRYNPEVETAVHVLHRAKAGQ